MSMLLREGDTVSGDKMEESEVVLVFFYSFLGVTGNDTLFSPVEK